MKKIYAFVLLCMMLAPHSAVATNICKYCRTSVGATFSLTWPYTNAQRLAFQCADTKTSAGNGVGGNCSSTTQCEPVCAYDYDANKCNTAAVPCVTGNFGCWGAWSGGRCVGDTFRVMSCSVYGSCVPAEETPPSTCCA